MLKSDKNYCRNWGWDLWTHRLTYWKRNFFRMIWNAFCDRKIPIRRQFFFIPKIIAMLPLLSIDSEVIGSFQISEFVIKKSCYLWILHHVRLICVQKISWRSWISLCQISEETTAPLIQWNLLRRENILLIEMIHNIVNWIFSIIVWKFIYFNPI